ncbi:MAG: GNAT family N-acetyltransferase [Candidatus Hodarchaeales archaeon]|jgi:ribosomal protein S18 acetylase RimI-like enzyme
MMIKKYQQDENFRKKLLQVLKAVDKDFLPPLSQRRSLDFWINLFEKGVIFYALDKEEIAGFLAYYPELTGSVFDDLKSCVNIDPVIKSVDSIKHFQGAYLHFIAISPAYRGEKIGSLLMEKLLEDASQYGSTKLRVVTWSTNKASIKLYRKFGFQIYNRIQDDRGKNIDSLYLEVKLPFSSSFIETVIPRGV